MGLNFVDRLAPFFFAMACLLTAGVIWRDVSELAEQAGSPHATEGLANPDATPGGAVDDFALLVNWPLFGGSVRQDSTAAAALAVAQDSGELPESTSSYRLFGIIAGADRAPRRAIMGTDEMNQRSYREGDAAPDGATLTLIQPRAVVLTRDGRSELLKLRPDAPGESDAGAEPTPLPGDGVVPDESVQPVAAEIPPESPQAPPAAAPAVPAAPIERIRQRIEAARAAAARGAGPAPIFEPPAP